MQAAAAQGAAPQELASEFRAARQAKLDQFQALCRAQRLPTAGGPPIPPPRSTIAGVGLEGPAAAVAPSPGFGASAGTFGQPAAATPSGGGFGQPAAPTPPAAAAAAAPAAGGFGQVAAGTTTPFGAGGQAEGWVLHVLWEERVRHCCAYESSSFIKCLQNPRLRTLQALAAAALAPRLRPAALAPRLRPAALASRQRRQQRQGSHTTALAPHLARQQALPSRCLGRGQGATAPAAAAALAARPLAAAVGQLALGAAPLARAARRLLQEVALAAAPLAARPPRRQPPRLANPQRSSRRRSCLASQRSRGRQRGSRPLLAQWRPCSRRRPPSRLAPPFRPAAPAARRRLAAPRQQQQA